MLNKHSVQKATRPKTMTVSYPTRRLGLQGKYGFYNRIVDLDIIQIQNTKLKIS